MSSIFILSSLSKCGFVLFGYNLMQYYRINKLQKQVATAGQIDLSYEKIDQEKLFSHKDNLFLIAGTNKNEINLKVKAEVFNEKALEIIAKPQNDMYLESQADENIEIKVKTYNRYIPFYDCSNLKANEIASIEDVKIFSLIEKLSYLKFYLFNLRQKKKIYSISKGISQNQRILVLSSLNFPSSNKILLKPQLIICSGLVEFEEMIEYLKNKRSVALFQITIFISLLTLIDFLNKSFSSKDKAK